MKNKNQPKGVHRFLLACFAMVCWLHAQAALEIEITQGVEAGIPIAIVPFEWRGAGIPPHIVSDIVEACQVCIVRGWYRVGVIAGFAL